jgi:DNA repair exonuclease SbcCD ATPase subunit
MPADEERLRIVEYDLKQFKTETVRVYQDRAFEMPMVKGLTEDAIKRLATLRERVDQRFNQVEAKLDEHTGTLNEQTIQLNRIETRLDKLEARFDEHTVLLTQILARLSN